MFLLKRNLASSSFEAIHETTEYVRFLTDVIQTFPDNVTAQQWDFIRIAISSWVLSLSKSSENWKTPQVCRRTTHYSKESYNLIEISIFLTL